MNYKILQGDSVEEMEKLKKDSVDLILTDPPYNLGAFMKSRQANIGRMRKNFFVDAGWDNLDYNEWLGKMSAFFEQSAILLKDGGSLVVFMAVIKVESIIELATKFGFYYKTTGIWHKKNPMPRNMNIQFVNSNESWIYFIKDKKTGTFNNQGRLTLDFIETSTTPPSERKFGKHPTQKPVSLMEFFIRLLSNPGNVILDPFMGSGTTGVAAVSNGREFIGIDLSAKYVEIAEKRIHALNYASVQLEMNLGRDRL